MGASHDQDPSSAFRPRETTTVSAGQAQSLGGQGTFVTVSTANGHKARVVLIVEDEFLVRCGVADELREAGYIVVETPSGEEAIALCKSDMTIDMVFTDINLIGAASGWEVGECFLACRPMCRCSTHPGRRSRPSAVSLLSPNHINTAIS